jgi:hypothetical protein
MSEEHWCCNCERVVYLDIHGKCDCYGSSAVVSQHLPTIQPALTGIERNERENHV